MTNQVLATPVHKGPAAADDYLTTACDNGPMRRLLILLSLVGCGGGNDMPADGAVADAAVVDVAMIDADPAALCAEDISGWRAIVAGLSRDCVVDDDCTIIGAPIGPCEGFPYIASSCHGDPVNAASYAASAAAAGAFEQAFRAHGCDCADGCAVDCGTARPRCVVATCIAEPTDSCLAPPLPPSLSGAISLSEVDVNGMPELGQGLTISVEFLKDAKPYSYEESVGPFGCKVTEYTPDDLAAALTQNEGTVTFTATDGAPSAPPCVFIPMQGYRCVGTSGTGGATVTAGGMLAPGDASYSISGAAFTAADIGRHLEIDGFVTAASNNGAFPILMVSTATEVVVRNPAAVTIAAAEVTTYASLAGRGPIPGLADPGLLDDTDAITVSLDSTGGVGDWAAFSQEVAVGDDFTLDNASQARISAIPVDGSGFVLDCAGAGGSCNTSLGTMVRITATDGPIAGLPSHEMPPPVSNLLTVLCAQVDTGLVTVGPLVSAYLQSAGATRIKTEYQRVQVVVPGILVVVGHSTIGFTTP